MTFRRLCKSLFGGLSAASVITLCLSITAPAQDQTSAPSTIRPLITSKIDDARLATLKGNVHPLATAANDRGAVDDSTPMTDLLLVLKRSPEQQAALDQLDEAQQSKSSPYFHQWLTPQQYGKTFGLADSDVAQITAWLESYGFHVDYVTSGRTFIKISGTAGALREAFHTQIHSYEWKGETYQANASDPKIPAALLPAIAGFASLNNFPRMKTVELGPSFERKKDSGKWEEVTKVPDQPQYSPTGDSGFYLITPGDFAKIYNLPTGNGAPTGAGVTIAIVEDTDIKTAADITTFRTQFGLPAYSSGVSTTQGSFQTFYGVKNGSTTYCSDPGVNADEDEAEIDVQWAGAVAQNSTLDMVSCPSSGSTYGFQTAATAVVDNIGSQFTNVSILSMSYGVAELALGTSGNTAWNTLWQQAATEGISVSVSTGDNLATSDGFEELRVRLSGTYHYAYLSYYGLLVNGTASTPYNVAAGGTDFGDTYAGTNSTYWTTTNSSTYESAKSYIPESTWNNSCASPLFWEYYSQASALAMCNNLTYWSTVTYGDPYASAVGGAGGLSNCTTVTGSTCSGGYAQPAWQSGVYGVTSGATRSIPDISLFASNGVWNHYLLFCFSDTSEGGTACNISSASTTDSGAGGTSFVAPQFAGIMGLVIQQNGKQGNPNYVLYRLASLEYGGPTNENTTGTAVGNVSTCASSLGASVSSNCIFYDVYQTTGNGSTRPTVTGTISAPCYWPSSSGASANCGGTSAGSTEDVGILSATGSATAPSYNLTAGYDYASGIGSINISNLVNAWANSADYLPSTTALTATPSSYTYGASTVLKATVTATNANIIKPTGTITFYYGTTAGAGTNLGTCTLAAATCSITTAALPGGSGDVSASYGGGCSANDDSSVSNYCYAGSTSPLVPVTVTAQTLTYGTGSVTPSSVAYSVSTAVALSQVVDWTGSGSAPTAGDFYFTLNGVNYPPTSCSGGTTDTCTYTVAGATIAALAAGSYPVTFNFTSDGNYASFSGRSVGTLTITTDTDKVTVTPAPTSIGPGGSSVVTIAVSNTQTSATSTPAGSVKLVDTTNAGLNLGTCTLSSGSCTITVPATSLVSGANTLTATYTASPANWATGTTGTGTLTLTSAPTTSVSLTPATTGSTTTGVTTATLTATITAASNDGLWGGTVTFTNTTTGATYSGTVTGSGTTGSASVTITLPDSGTSAGLDNYTAKYNGTANYAASAASNSVAVYWQGLLISTDLSHNFSGLISYGSPAITVEGTQDGTKLGPYGVVVYNFTTATQTVGLNFANASSGAFSYVTNCPASLAAGKTCNYYFYYAPPNGDGCNPSTNCTKDSSNYPQGTYESGTWQITSGAPLGIGDTGFDRSGPVAFPATLAGKAVLSTASPINVTPLTYTFGPLAPGELSNTLTITVTNPGAASVGLSYTPPVTTPFQATNYCPANLAANSNCTINVTFQNSTTGTVTDKVIITPSGGSAITVSLTGIVNTNNGLQLSTNSHSFGNVTTGSSAASFGLSITNHASTAATLSFGTSQSGTTPYNVVTSGCPSALAAGAQCSVVVGFSPTAAGTFNDVLTVNSNVPILPDGTGSSPNYSDTVSFTGTGVSAGQFTATSVNHNWGNVTVGTTGTNYGVQLTNATSTTVTLTLGAGFTQGQYGFSLAGTNCGSTLAVNASCELIFSFSPTGAGAVSASYGVTAVNTSSNPVQLYSGGNPYSAITLVGTGQ
jgi:hypothetical protein